MARRKGLILGLPGGPALAFSENGLVTTTYADDATTKGQGFILQKNFTIASAASLFLLIDYTTYAKSGGIIYAEPPAFHTSVGVALVNVYREGDYAGGAALPLLNINTTNPAMFQTTITQGPTGADKGTLSLEYLVGTAATPQSAGGGGDTVGPAFIRANTNKTLVEIINNCRRRNYI